MGESDRTQAEHGRKRRPIIELSGEEAHAFFIKQESYCTIDLPRYFQFDGLLQGVAEVLEGKKLSEFCHRKPQPRRHEGVNHQILNNKDGRYAWRPLDLIHPALYISLVKCMTEQSNWELICNRFHYFRRNSKIKCLSLPVKSLTKEKDKAEQVSQWWETVEQKSIELSLDYEFIIRTDIVDCYAAIYTHSIAWALHTKSKAKENRNKKNWIGNIIDNHIQDMRQGQTNGIPQGSVLMNFIAEMVLGYADTELTKKITLQKIEDYKILRYRDDYRIFVNNPRDGESILKCLTEVMIDLGLKLSPAKTKISSEVVCSSIKDEKLSWMFRKQCDKNLQKHLLIIHDHSMKHPHAGSLAGALDDYYRRLLESKKCDFPLPLIGILVDISYRNPRTYAISAVILGKLVDFLETPSDKQEIIKRIRRKFSQIPNTGHVQLWLQRISLPFDSDIDFDEPLCQLVHQVVGQENEQIQVWNNKWISSKDLQDAIDPNKIFDSKEFAKAKVTPVVPIEEVELFTSDYS